MSIIKDAGLVAENIYLMDTRQFGVSKSTAAFLYWDGERALIMDTGTSDNIDEILGFIDRLRIPPEKIIGVTGTHYHFDHMGGATRLWTLMEQKNRNFKIIVPEDMKYYLQNARLHIKGAGTTFGHFVGKMEPVKDDAYLVVEKDRDLPVDLGGDITVRLIETPGHTPDHCAPTFFKGGRAFFSFAGESCGCLYHMSEPVSSPTSMPPNFHFDSYMDSAKKVAALKPGAIGFCHYGVLDGSDAVQSYLENHLRDMNTFRGLVVDSYGKNNSTRDVMEGTREFFKNTFDPLTRMPEKYMENLQLAIVYGLMVDLGFKEPKYENRSVPERAV